MNPSSRSANEIMVVILSLCAGNACKMSALMEHDAVVTLIQEYGKTRVRSVIYSLATVGWLYCRGRTNSALYQTTARGMDALKDLTEAQGAIIALGG